MSRWIAAAGAFVVSLDSMVNIAFPAIAAAFGTPPERVRWIIVCYVFTYALMSFVGGAAADRLGHASVLKAGMALSVAGFLLVGAAPTFGWVLAGRAVQGVGAGLVYGTTPALVTAGALEAARGRRLGFLAAAIGLGFALGPLPAGAGSVGTMVEMRHLAATPVGMKVRAKATLLETDGRRFLFSVEAWDEKEKIAEGRHERFVVPDMAKFLGRALKKGSA